MEYVECPYCGKPLECIDYYGHMNYHNQIEKQGNIYQCQNEECESQAFNGYFYDRCDDELEEGYPC